MSINNKRSYTEYTVTQPTTDFAIGFDDFDEGGKDNILVTLNGVLVESLGYAAIRKNESTVTITPAITEGTVRLTRETDIDEPFHKFTAGALFSAKSMDENFQQVRHSQQEVRDGFVFLEHNTNGIVQASKEATAQAKAATVEATASAVRAESAADTAVQAVGSLQGVVDAATTATTKANTATASATTAASQATAATTSAQNAALSATVAKQEAQAATANANAATVDTLTATGRANDAADVVADLVVGKVRAQDVSTELGLTQRDFNYGVGSVASLLALPNPIDGVVVNTASYLAGQKVGGNTYRYNSARAAENDGGSVINGWEVVGKTALTVWDFGYEVGNQQGSKAALTKALISVMPLELLAETLNAHVGVGAGNDVLAQTIDINKHIFGTGSDSSVIEGLRLQFTGDTFLARDFSINKNGLNYAIFIGGYKDVTIENFRSRGNLDAVLIMHAKDDNSKALVSNCYSENSSRIGFTADVGAKNVKFDTCVSYNCRQGFHAEIQEDTTFIDCIADACGDGAVPAIPDIQPPEYAGGFRLHEFDGVSLIRCKNINKNGTNIDQIGGRGKDLSIDGCEGLNFYIENYASAVYENISILNTKNCSLNVDGRGASIKGKLIIRNFDGGSLDMIGANITAVNSVEYMELVNVRAHRVQIGTLHPKAVLYADNVHITSDYFNEWKGFIHFILGDLTLTRPNLNNEHYPNFGFIFNSINCKTFSLNKFTLAGAGAAYALHFREMPTGLRCTILSSDGIGNHFNIDNPAGVEINNLTYALTGNSQGVVTTTLSSATSNINKYGKFRGKELWDDTSNKFMKATGGAPTSPWVSLDGATTITPA